MTNEEVMQIVHDFGVTLIGEEDEGFYETLGFLRFKKSVEERDEQVLQDYLERERLKEQ